MFQSDNDASPKMNKEVAQELKKRTGITLELQTVSNEDSTEALTSGLASGDLPDFIVYYLDDSGRPEMKVLNKAAKQGRLTDLTKMLKNTKIYSKYFKKDIYQKIRKITSCLIKNKMERTLYIWGLTVIQDKKNVAL